MSSLEAPAVQAAVDARYGQKRNPASTRLFEGQSASRAGRPSRHDIVNQQDALPGDIP